MTIADAQQETGTYFVFEARLQRLFSFVSEIANEKAHIFYLFFMARSCTAKNPSDYFRTFQTNVFFFNPRFIYWTKILGFFFKYLAMIKHSGNLGIPRVFPFGNTVEKSLLSSQILKLFYSSPASFPM